LRPTEINGVKIQPIESKRGKNRVFDCSLTGRKHEFYEDTTDSIIDKHQHMHFFTFNTVLV